MATTQMVKLAGFLRFCHQGAVRLLLLGGCVAIGATAAGAASPMTHGSANIGSTKYGVWGEGYTCATCHVNSVTPNIRKVAPTIVTPTGSRPVVFKRVENLSNYSTGVFGNDERQYAQDASTNVCEVCHHQTKYHQYSSAKIADKVHSEHRSNRRDCMKCHSHRYGFRPPVAGDCIDCHGNPPLPGTTLQTDLLTFPGNTFGGAYGAHQKHYFVLGLNCATCHNGSVHGLLGNEYLEFGFRVDGVTWPSFEGSVTSGTITLPSEATYSVVVAPNNPGTTVQRAAGTITCSIYCHGDGWDSNKAPGTISWVSGALNACNTSVCHGTTPARPPMPSKTTGAHPRHVGSNQYACTTCHDNYTDPHMVNGKVKWNLSSQGGGALYKGFNVFSTTYLAGSAATAYGNCTNIYCHSDVQSGTTGTATASVYRTVTWAGGLLACDGCHGGGKTDAAPIASGSHAKHISTYGYACDACHTGAGKSVETRHADKNIDVAMGGTYGGTYSQAVNPPGNGYGTCSATYCHSDGKGATVSAVPWGGAALSCTACHQLTGITTGKHAAHVNNNAFLGTSFGCVTCHASTVQDNTTLVSTPLKHVNGFADYSGVRSGRYTTGTGACSASYCHSDGKGSAPAVAVNWQDGSTINDCKGCHGVASTAGFASAVGEPNYVNTGAGTSHANSHGRHMGGVGLYTCVYCHDDTVTSAGLKTGTLHLNGSKNVKAGSGRSFNWTAGTKTCDNISCHGGPSAIQWGASMPADCTGCHGGNVSSGNPQTTGKHGAHMNNAAVLGTNYACVTCHALTVSTDRTIADPMYHGNGFKNFTGPTAGGRSSYSTVTGICSAAYCHSDGKGTLKDMTATTWKSSATLDCKGCHGADAAPAFVSLAGEPNYANTGPGQPRANNHQNHIDTGATACANCHGATVATSGTAIVGSHTNRVIDVVAGNGKSFTWSAAGKTCSDISCHGGVGSFTQTWGTGLTPNCLGCHGNNLASGVPIASGQHPAHINNAGVLGANYSCTECHAKTINPDERSFAFPANHGNGYKNFSGVRAGGDSSYTTATGVCSATYCHTDGKGTQKMTAANGWKAGSTLDCRGCHGTDAAPAFASAAGEPNYANAGANQPRANSHQKHVGTSGQAATCVFCHGTTVTSSGTAIIGNHTDRVITVAAGGSKSFAWTEGTKTCATISCHGSGSPSAQWGQTLPADCTGCHGGAAGSGSAISTNQHPAHINNAGILGTNIGCVACHANTVSNTTTIGTAAMHANGLANYSGAFGGKNKAACNAAYCHSNGKGTAGAAVSWTTGPALGCNGCHGLTTTSGAPDYPNGGAAAYLANSHLAHTTKIAGSMGAASCAICHNNTVTTSGTAIKAGSAHLNGGLPDVNFNPGREATAVWNGVAKTCSTITCHGGANATWGDPNSAGCQVCHGVLSGAHTAHVNNFMALGPNVYGNFSANRSTGTVYRFGCANCHPTDIAKHQNGLVDVTLNRNKAGGGYLNSLNTLVESDTAGYTKNSPSDFTCEAAYCHSSGKSLSQIDTDYRQSPNWYGGAYSGNKCGMCHDNPPQYAGQSHYVAASSLGNNGTPPYRESGHMINIHFKSTAKGNNQRGFLGFSSAGDKAHGNPALATTIACYYCHSGIVSSTRIDTYAMSGSGSNFRCGRCHTASTPTPLQVGEIVNTSKHVNGVKNVAFAPVTFRTKAQITNVNNILGWTRNGGYKAAGSYDSFELGNSTWDAQTKTCLTLCHVNQPNITWGAQLQCNSCHAKQ
jgi:predicted CxxxxCH...CXXCH cytochrome family protein